MYKYTHDCTKTFKLFKLLYLNIFASIKKVGHLAVMRIRDIMVRIRIRFRIRGPIRILLLSSLTLKMATKNYFYFYSKFFLFITFWSYIYISFKDKKSQISHKTIGLKFFLLFLLDYRRIRIRIRTSYYWIRIRIQEPQTQNKQHCFKVPNKIANILKKFGKKTVH